MPKIEDYLVDRQSEGVLAVHPDAYIDPAIFRIEIDHFSART